MLKLIKAISPELKYSCKRMFSEMKSYGAGESHVQLALKLSSKNLGESDLAKLEPVIEEGKTQGLQSYFLDINLETSKNLDDVPQQTMENIETINRKFKDFRFCGVSCKLPLDRDPAEFLVSKPFISLARLSKNISEKKLCHDDTWLMLTETDLIDKQHNFDVNVKALYSFVFGVQNMKLLYLPGYLPQTTASTYQSSVKLLHKDVDVGFSLANNRAFQSNVTKDKRANSAEFLKYLFDLGEQLDIVELHDYQINDGKFQEVELGKGVLDFKLFMNMIKSMTFKGMFLIDATEDLALSKANLNFISALLKESNFELKNTKEILEYITYRKIKKPFVDSDLESIMSKIII